MTCRECKGRCVYTHMDLTCTECGLEQGECMLVPEFDAHERTAPFDDLIQNMNHTRSFMVRKDNLFDFIEPTMNVPEAVIRVAKELYVKINERKRQGIKGQQRHLELACACVYFSSRTMNSGVLTQQNIISRVQGVSSIQWAVKLLSEELSNDYPDLFMSRSIDLKDSTSRMISTIVDYFTASRKNKDKDWRKVLFPIVHKLQEQVQYEDDVQAMNPEKVNATLLLMACKIVHAPITLKKVALLLKASEPTLLKIEQVIQKIIKVRMK